MHNNYTQKNKTYPLDLYSTLALCWLFRLGRVGEFYRPHHLGDVRHQAGPQGRFILKASPLGRTGNQYIAL